MTALVQLQAREDLMTLAHQAITFFNASFASELAALSDLPAEDRDNEFRALCAAVRADDTDQIETALDVLTGGAR